MHFWLFVFTIDFFFEFFKFLLNFGINIPLFLQGSTCIRNVVPVTCTFFFYYCSCLTRLLEVLISKCLLAILPCPIITFKIIRLGQRVIPFINGFHWWMSFQLLHSILIWQRHLLKHQSILTNLLLLLPYHSLIIQSSRVSISRTCRLVNFIFASVGRCSLSMPFHRWFPLW